MPEANERTDFELLETFACVSTHMVYCQIFFFYPTILSTKLIDIFSVIKLALINLNFF